METNQISSKPLIKEALLDAPVHRVWKAITNYDDMKQWYFEMKDFKPIVGFEFQFYGEKDGRKFLHLCQVKEVIENKRISYSWTYDTHPDAETLVIWELFPEGNKTRLRLTHDGLDKLPQDPDFAVDNFKAGWNEIVDSLLRNYVGVLDQTVEKSIDIQAGTSKVWDVLIKREFSDKWAEAFMPGIYVESGWKEGSEVLWKDKEGTVFVKGIVLTNKPNQLLEVGFYDEPTMSPPAQIGKYKEAFAIADQQGKTRLSIHSGPVSKQDSKEHAALWETALNKMKELAEQ